MVRPQAKHIPQRTCLGCRNVRPKQAMVRIVRTREGRLAVDATGKAQGRGAYVCAKAACAAQALRPGTLSRALRTGVDAAAVAELQTWAAQLSE